MVLYLPGQTKDALRGQIAVIGSGPAGIALASALGEAGHDVVVLESGLHAPDEFAASLSSAAEVPDLHAKPGEGSTRRFGGASWLWGGRCLPYDPIDFEPRPDAEGPGWPIDRDDALRHATQAAAFLGIGQPDFGCPSFGELETSPMGATLERWCAEPRLMRRHAKALRASKSVRVYLGLTCTGAEIDGDGWVRSLSARNADGKTVTIRTQMVALAAGGIETARLLLWFFENLPPNAKPRWLGRGYMGHLAGAIAQIMLQPDAAHALDYRRDGIACFVRQRLLLSPAVLRKEALLNIGFHIDNPPLHDPRHKSAGLSVAALALGTPALGPLLMPDPLRTIVAGPPLGPRSFLRHAANVAGAPWNAAAFGFVGLHGRLTRPLRPGLIDRNPAGRYTLKFSAEQIARYLSSVRLSQLRDAHNVPRVAIAPYIGSFDVESVLRAHDILDQELRRSGLARLEFPLAPAARAESVFSQSGDGYHQIGLARMSASADTGVVDQNARVHGLANIYVAGSATFPTSSQANPTFMIICQALRLASHLSPMLNAPARAGASAA